jgi:hypothetical protein
MNTKAGFCNFAMVAILWLLFGHSLPGLPSDSKSKVRDSKVVDQDREDMLPGNDTELSQLLRDARADILSVGQRVKGREARH